jgi:hypothetical protein
MYFRGVVDITIFETYSSLTAQCDFLVHYRATVSQLRKSFQTMMRKKILIKMTRKREKNSTYKTWNLT